MPISSTDRQILRDLALRVAEIADLPIMLEKRKLWKRHNALQSVRPMMLVFPEGSWCELQTGADLCCEGEEARRFEWDLRSRLYAYDHFQDDTVVENEWKVYAAVRDTGWGLATEYLHSGEARGTYSFNPVLTCADDVKKIHAPEVIYDEAATRRQHEEAEALFGDILQVKDAGVMHFGFHLMQHYITWRGVSQTLLDMVEEPQLLHDVMAILEDGYRQNIHQLEAMNLFRLNNDSSYSGSGGVNYTDELPAPGFDPAHVRFCDLWGRAESQEMAAVSPEMHEEFAMQYERRLLEPFGLNAYGCCEDLTHKLDYVFTLPNLRRISISPWANVDVCAEKLQNRYIFSWKPQPSHLCGNFDEDFVRAYIRHTLDVTHGCVLEIILKDTHTCDHHPERFDAWTRIARELIDEYAGDR